MSKGYYDFEAIKKNVPIRDVINFYTGQNVSERGSFHCPDPKHNDKNPSATIHVAKNNCHCWSCGGTYNVLEVVQVNKNCDFHDAAEILCRDFGLNEYVNNNDDRSETRKRSAITQVLLRKIGLDGNEISLEEEKDDAFDKEYAKYAIFELMNIDPVKAYELVIKHLKERIEKLNDALEWVEQEISEVIEEKGVDYIQMMLTYTNTYMEYRQNEVSAAKKAYSEEIAKEKAEFISTGKNEKAFKPSHPFKKPVTTYEFKDNSRYYIEKGLEYLDHTNFIKDNKKELELMNKSLEKIINEYNNISPKSKEDKVKSMKFDLFGLKAKRDEMAKVEDVILSDELTKAKKIEPIKEPVEEPKIEPVKEPEKKVKKAATKTLFDFSFDKNNEAHHKAEPEAKEESTAPKKKSFSFNFDR